MAKKLAVALLQLDIGAAAGDAPMQHRYCTQVVAPLLQALVVEPRIRVSVAAMGAGLEFLAEHYPGEIERLKLLLARRQVDLVSSLYAPAAWPLFPARDVNINIALNRATLGRLGLDAVPAFYGGDGFFGAGLEALADRFEFALCKDTYITALSRGGSASPIRRLGRMPVLVGSHHILAELARRVISDRAAGADAPRSAFHEARLEEAVRTPAHSAPAAIAGILGEVSWRWAHFAGAHHFTARSALLDWENLFFDPAWLQLCLRTLSRLDGEGFELTTISELWRELQPRAGEPEPLPAMPEAGWDPRATAGVLQWCGRLQKWHSAVGLLELVWRARAALRRLDDAGAVDAAELDEIWRLQLMAESARGLDASAPPAAAAHARQHAEAVLRRCARAAAAVTAQEGVLVRAAEPWAEAEMIGVEGAPTWFQHGDMQLGEVRFRQEEGECGVRFRRRAAVVEYSPSGAEDRLASLDLTRLRPPVVHLPLANGLVGLGDDLYVIRVNTSCPVAVAVDRSTQWLKFAVEGGPEGRPHEWRFLCFRGEAPAAIAHVNRINLC